MTFTNRSLIAGAFTDEAQAQQAVADLQQADFSDDQIRYSVHKGGAGILDSLIDLGLGQEEARYYNREFLNGRTIVTVKTTDRQQEAAARERLDAAPAPEVVLPGQRPDLPAARRIDQPYAPSHLRVDDLSVW